MTIPSPASFFDDKSVPTVGVAARVDGGDCVHSFQNCRRFNAGMVQHSCPMQSVSSLYEERTRVRGLPTVVGAPL